MSHDESRKVGSRLLTGKGKRVVGFLTIWALAVLLASCATQPAVPGSSLPGFLSGLLHGFLIMFSFIASFFTDYRIYAFPNNGAWYDFGYLLGASAFLGGGGASAR